MILRIEDSHKACHVKLTFINAFVKIIYSLLIGFDEGVS